VTLVVFDLLGVDGTNITDITDRPYSERRDLLVVGRS
jgi:ATP-dependent DNA ligase